MNEREKIDKPLLPEEIEAIYEESEGKCWSPNWKYDNEGNKVGYERVSIDAWCE